MHVLSHAALEMETVRQYKMEDNRKSLMMQSSLGQRHQNRTVFIQSRTAIYQFHQLPNAAK